MSKGKSNKQNEKENNFHNDAEVKKITTEPKTEQSNINPDVFPDISSTVKMTNPGEEIKIHAENIIEVQPEKKEEIKVNIINVADKKHDIQPEKVTANKESLKIDIVDISKKKGEKSSNKNKFNSFFNIPLNGKLDLSNLKLQDKDLEKALDSLIYLGGGVIAVTSITSKAFANIGNFLIKK